MHLGIAVELMDHRFHDAVEQFLPAGDVVIQRHAFDAEVVPSPRIMSDRRPSRSIIAIAAPRIRRRSNRAVPLPGSAAGITDAASPRPSGLSGSILITAMHHPFLRFANVVPQAK